MDIVCQYEQKELLKQKDDRISELESIIRKMDGKMDKVIDQNDDIKFQNKTILKENKKMSNNISGLKKTNKKMVKENKKMIKENKKMIKENKKMVKENKKMVKENKKMIKENKKINGHIKIVLRDRSPAPTKKIKTDFFGIMKLNGEEDDKTYVMIRRKAETFNVQVEKVKERYPNATSIKKIKVPNPTLFGDSLEKLMNFKKNKKLEFNTSTNNDEELIQKIDEIHKKLKTQVNDKIYI